jgi:CDP-diacylglycerol--glycerol-3-phosphate 3-phosphatidyltransferase
MLDRSVSIGILAVFFTAAVAFAVRVLTLGSFQDARASQLGGSPFLPPIVLQFVYWTIGPWGRGYATLGVSPNAVTWLSGAVGVAGGIALAAGHLGVGALCILLSILHDLLDGMVARLTGNVSVGGGVLDQVLDRYVDFAWLGGLMVCYRAESPVFFTALFALLGAAMVSYVSSVAERLVGKSGKGLMKRGDRTLVLLLATGLTPLLGRLLPDRALVLAALGLIAVFANLSAAMQLRALATVRR